MPFSANNILNMIPPACSHQFWSTEDGFLVAGKTGFWMIWNPANSLQIWHPPRSRKIKEALGGGFGSRSKKKMRFFFVITWCLLWGETYWTILPSCNLQVSVPTVNITEVIGVVRESEKPSIFVPANDPTTCQWFYVDVPAIARAAGLTDNTIYIEDINENVNPSNPYPLPKDVNTLIRSSVMPQDHLNYTFTWYAFLVLLIFKLCMNLESFLSEWFDITLLMIDTSMLSSLFVFVLSIIIPTLGGV